jgi:hypothetical protein
VETKVRKEKSEGREREGVVAYKTNVMSHNVGVDDNWTSVGLFPTWLSKKKKEKNKQSQFVTFNLIFIHTLESNTKEDRLISERGVYKQNRIV